MLEPHHFSEKLEVQKYALSSVILHTYMKICDEQILNTTKMWQE